MGPIEFIEPPENFDLDHWVRRWDRMQERYLVRRNERFATMARLVRDTQPNVRRILDLGCGSGSLMLGVLEAFPEAEVIGIDYDPTLLLLARRRLAEFGDRATIVLADLRDSRWVDNISTPVDAVVSATALHWFSEHHLSKLYKRIADVMRPGGIFLNADHVGSESEAIQMAWEQSRQEMRIGESDQNADDWDGFWSDYFDALGMDIRNFHQRVIGGYENGIEGGLPLTWHFDMLRKCGFSSVDCFWRLDCDAIYGGIRE
jgi:SAM-dependent methyltransferase